jgi:hypothetical protein
MPLKDFHPSGKQSGWAIWHITETEQQLLNGIIGAVPGEIVNEKKRLEWLASRHVILTLCNHLGLRFFGVRKDVGRMILESPIWKSIPITFRCRILFRMWLLKLIMTDPWELI